MTDGEILSNLAGEPTEPRILDSGTRREFASGAVRDIQEGKGRCDLLPLDVVGDYLSRYGTPASANVVGCIRDFQETGNVANLFDGLYIFTMNRTGWGLDHFTMLLEVSKHFEEGAKKYGEDNWQKGIDVHCYIDSAVRHYLKFLRGDQDEPHDRAFCWNILCAIWTCKHKPELNEYGKDSITDKLKDDISRTFGLPKSILFDEGDE
jgi:hypothetical protein